MNILRNTVLVALLTMAAVIGTSSCTVDGGVALGASCIDDRDCAPGDFCSVRDGVCISPPEPVGTVVVGDGCVYDTECADGDYCDQATGLCVADAYTAGYGAPGDPCWYDGDCASDFCDVVTDTCN